jgi:hypothetical protein
MKLTKAFRQLNWEFWLTTLAGVMALLTTVVVYVVPQITGTPEPSPATVEITTQIRRTLDRLDYQDEQLGHLQGQLQSLSNVPEEGKIAVQLKTLDDTLSELKVRQSKLEEVILNNPAKAIEVPLLRKDLDNLKDAQQQNVLALKQGVEQVYDLNKWLLGTMAISIIMLVLSKFFGGGEKDKTAS